MSKIGKFCFDMLKNTKNIGEQSWQTLHKLLLLISIYTKFASFPATFFTLTIFRLLLSYECSFELQPINLPGFKFTLLREWSI